MFFVQKCANHSSNRWKKKRGVKGCPVLLNSVEVFRWHSLLINGSSWSVFVCLYLHFITQNCRNPNISNWGRTEHGHGLQDCIKASFSRFDHPYREAAGWRHE